MSICYIGIGKASQDKYSFKYGDEVWGILYSSNVSRARDVEADRVDKEAKEHRDLEIRL